MQNRMLLDGLSAARDAGMALEVYIIHMFHVYGMTIVFRLGNQVVERQYSVNFTTHYFTIAGPRDVVFRFFVVVRMANP